MGKPIITIKALDKSGSIHKVQDFGVNLGEALGLPDVQSTQRSDVEPSVPQEREASHPLTNSTEMDDIFAKINEEAQKVEHMTPEEVKTIFKSRVENVPSLDDADDGAVETEEIQPKETTDEQPPHPLATGTEDFDPLKGLFDKMNEPAPEKKVGVEKIELDTKEKKVKVDKVQVADDSKKVKTDHKGREMVELDELQGAILGKDRRDLLTRALRYKVCFPEVCKPFKIPKEPTLRDLQELVDEMDIAVSTENAKEFLVDGLLQGIGFTENVLSFMTKGRLDVRGLAEDLGRAPDFRKVILELSLKYNCYSSVPPEMRLALIVMTSAITRLKINKMNSTKSLESLSTDRLKDIINDI